MRTTENNKKPNNSVMVKIMFVIWIITVIPLIIMFMIYSSNPDSPLLNYLSEATNGLLVLHSANNPLLSTVMNVWCKTAPLWGGVSFIFSYKYIEINGEQTIVKMIKGLVLFSILYLPIMYMLLLNSAEITESGKLYKLMSKNDCLLFTLFATIYSICYISTVYYLVIVVAAFKLFIQKGRELF